MPAALIFIVLVVFVGLSIFANAVRVVREYERLVVFRLGRLIGEKGPGLVLLIPIVDRAVKGPLPAIVTWGFGFLSMVMVASIFDSRSTRSASER